MGAFAECQKVEARSRRILHPFIEQRSFEGRYVLLEKGRLAAELQKAIGDVIHTGLDGQLRSLELKAEEENKHGNFFLETWSNLSRLTPGWMITSRSDLLLYHFLSENTLCVMNLPRLQDWAFRQRNIYEFNEKQQRKYNQMNDTWGRCVPIDIIERDVKLVRFNLEAVP